MLNLVREKHPGRVLTLAAQRDACGQKIDITRDKRKIACKGVCSWEETACPPMALTHFQKTRQQQLYNKFKETKFIFTRWHRKVVRFHKKQEKHKFERDFKLRFQHAIQLCTSGWIDCKFIINIITADKSISRWIKLLKFKKWNLHATFFYLNWTLKKNY